MRAVLRTIAQCHANRILHRDVKPGNFMLLEDQPLSPVKAIGTCFGHYISFLLACNPKLLQRRSCHLASDAVFIDQSASDCLYVSQDIDWLQILAWLYFLSQLRSQEGT